MLANSAVTGNRRIGFLFVLTLAGVWRACTCTCMALGSAGLNRQRLADSEVVSTRVEAPTNRPPLALARHDDRSLLQVIWRSPWQRAEPP